MTISLSSENRKDRSMAIQKDMLAGHYAALENVKETGKKVVYTFVPGNVIELIKTFDMLPILPEIDALQAGMRKLSDGYIAEAEKEGHSEDVCTYVKTHIGMIRKGMVGPTGIKLPKPDMLLLSYTGCFTFMKWFELLKEEFDCPVVMLHIPYQSGEGITADQIEYVVKQLRVDVIPMMEEVSGNKYDKDKIAGLLEKSAAAEENWVKVLNSAKTVPSPIDAYFGGVYYTGPIFSFFRGSDEAVEYYEIVAKEIQARIDEGLGPVTPEGPMKEEKYRIVVEGPPNWTHFREFWKMFYDEGAVVVASTYTKVGGVYDNGFRHDPAKPLESLAEYCLGCYTNIGIPDRVQMIVDYIKDFKADGFIINSIKSCNAFSAGQLMMLREIEERAGVPGGFIESDLVDSRYFSASNIKNRLESYFQMLRQKKLAEVQ